jgi:hypothetical protein
MNPPCGSDPRATGVTKRSASPAIRSNISEGRYERVFMRVTIQINPAGSRKEIVSRLIRFTMRIGPFLLKSPSAKL